MCYTILKATYPPGGKAMLRQYDFSFPMPDLTHVNSELAVKLHGALMESIHADAAG